MLVVLTSNIEYMCLIYKIYNELDKVPQLASFKLDFGLEALLNT